MLYPKPINPIKHSIENLTRSSIILQPPVSQQQVSSHLFAHLGQMVSTPIGSTFSTQTPPIPLTTPTTSTTTLVQPALQPGNVTSSILQPTLQPGMPYMPNLLTGVGGLNQSSGLPQPQLQQHSFPVLYNSPTVIPRTTATEVQPLSLYAEYIGNPYNVHNAERIDNSSATTQETHHAPSTLDKPSLIQAPTPDDPSSVLPNLTSSTTPTNHFVQDTGTNVIAAAPSDSMNFFQSSNYFSAAGVGFVPAGSEILFGVEKSAESSSLPESQSAEASV